MLFYYLFVCLYYVHYFYMSYYVINHRKASSLHVDTTKLNYTYLVEQNGLVTMHHVAITWTQVMITI